MISIQVSPTGALSTKMSGFTGDSCKTVADKLAAKLSPKACIQETDENRIQAVGEVKIEAQDG